MRVKFSFIIFFLSISNQNSKYIAFHVKKKSWLCLEMIQRFDLLE